MSRSRSLVLLAVLACPMARAGTEITYRGYVKEMKAQDIDVRHVTDDGVAVSYERLIGLIETKLTKLEAGSEKGAHEDKVVLLRSVLHTLETQRTASAPDRRAAYVAALRGLYSVEAEPFEDSRGLRNRLYIAFKAPGRLWTRAPRMTPEDLDMTHAAYVRARKPRHAVEAEGLVDASGARMAVESLENKTLRQIADLDVAPDHPTWLQEADRARFAATAWERIERRVEARVARSETFAKARGSEAAPYDLQTARRVLFLDKIKESATAPKLDTLDAFGMRWKVKFGNQAQPEPISSRLFVLLGQKFVDLVYTNRRGGKELVVVLRRGDEVGSIRTTLAKGRYRFDLAPYLDATGVIREVRGSRLIGSSGEELAPLPAGARLGPDDLLGRAYMTFRETEVEFQGGEDVYGRVGPVAKNFAGAEDDRGERAGLIANMWVNNFDAKDENSRTVLIPGSGEAGATAEPEVLEIYHDLGGTLGDQAGGFGRVNKLKTGESFLRVGRKNLKFKQFMLYRPKAWSKATAADGLWMARKVASITRGQIEEVVAHSYLPDFAQEVYVYKIMDRRDRIADAYGLTAPDRATAPSIDIDLSPSNRATVAQRLGLDARLLDQEIEDARRHGFEGDLDHVVVDGRFRECQDTVVLGLLESESYPSGLTRRTKATKDDHPLPRCRYGVKPARY